MKRKWSFFVFLTLILCLFCVGGYFVMEQSCIGSHPIDDLEELLIEKNDLPPGWTFEYKIPITGEFDFGEKNVMIAYSRKSETGFARQYLYQFKNSVAASFSYNLLKKRLPLVQNNQENFADYESQIANAWYMACEYSTTDFLICDIFSRYENFIVYFSISTKTDQLTPEQLYKILLSIDSRMERLLGG